MSQLAVSLDFSLFSPSYLQAFDDLFLSFSVLMLCMVCYIEQDDDPVNDFMISPLRTPGDIFARFPRTYVLICQLDPMYDDGLRFADQFL